MSNRIKTAADNLSAALSTNIIPTQEYFLQGSVLDTAVTTLLHRLRGLCDNTNTISNCPETFQDHEMAYSIEIGPPPEKLIHLRVRRSLDNKDMPYQLHYIGQTEIGDKSRPTLIRSRLDIATSDHITDFLLELGCKKDFEYVARGCVFLKGRMKVTVSKIFYSPNVNEFENAFATDETNLKPITKSHLLEISVIAPIGQDVIARNMKTFAETLKPLVQLEKTDYTQFTHYKK